MSHTKKTTKRWVVKIGSALITNRTGINLTLIKQWAKQIHHLRQSGIEVILVSSGAIAEGMTRTGLTERPSSLKHLQALAAIGQAGMIQTYQQCFDPYNINTSQVLLTHDELKNRQRYLNARNTLITLLDYQTLPIVNENDTISFDEIRLGDNDTLSATIANMVKAEQLIILTDQKGLYNKDPRHHTDARFIALDSANNDELLQFAGGAGTQVGTGGMQTKILAARRAARSNCSTIITSGQEQNVLIKLSEGESLGTLLKADEKPLAAKKQWLADQLQQKGTLTLDQGAVSAIREGGSILPIGVTDIKGNFNKDDIVSCVDSKGNIVAQGVMNYNSKKSQQIKGMTSQSIKHKVGIIDNDELIHRDNLVILNPNKE